VVLVPAGSREEELDAVAANAVVAGVESGATDRAESTLPVGAARDPELDLHDVPRVAPHFRVVRVVDEVVLDPHDDHAGSILLADDPRDRVGGEVDLSVALGEAPRPRVVRARMKAPWGDSADGRNLRAGGGSTGRSGQAAEPEQQRQHQHPEPASLPDAHGADYTGAHRQPAIGSPTVISADILCPCPMS